MFILRPAEPIQQKQKIVKTSGTWYLGNQKTGKNCKTKYCLTYYNQKTTKFEQIVRQFNCLSHRLYPCLPSSSYITQLIHQCSMYVIFHLSSAFGFSIWVHLSQLHHHKLHVQYIDYRFIGSSIFFICTLVH